MTDEATAARLEAIIREAADRAIERETKRAEKEADRQERVELWRIKHEAELEAKRREREAERDARRAEHATASAPRRLTSEEAFVAEMAAKRGITPDEFRELQALRRRQMAVLPSYEEQMKAAPVVGAHRPVWKGEAETE